MKNYQKFLEDTQYTDVQGILFLESDEIEDYDWSVIFNVTSYWDKYLDGTLTIEQFNQKLTDFLLKQNEHITGECWTELNEILNELKIEKDNEKSETIYNKIYDLFDKNNINLKIESKEEDESQEVQ
jgi:hypothetical protein